MEDHPALSTSPDRVFTTLNPGLPRIGTLRPRHVSEVGDSNWTLGCETLDRDFADYDQYRDYLAPLGLKKLRFQAGWAKCERRRGAYDFAWLDHIVDDALSRGLSPILETGYGNPIYPGGGGFDLGSGFPSSEEGLAARAARRRPCPSLRAALRGPRHPVLLRRGRQDDG